jgi:hypothetical protein
MAADARVVGSLSLDSCLPALHAQQNARLPISRLFPELISKIFHILSAQSPPRPLNRDLAWIKVTHVYSRWRQTGCADSTLWTRIDLDFGRWWISEMLQRAQSVQLSCFMHAPNASELAFAKRDSKLVTITSLIETVVPHLHHISELRLYLPSHDVASNIFRSICSSKPALKVLQLSFGGNLGQEPLPELPLEFDAGHTLRSLTLTHIGVSWDLEGRSLVNLEKLNIEWPGSHRLSEYPSPSFARLSSLISTMHHLRDLSLHCFPITSKDLRDTRCLELRHLHKLVLAGTLSDCNRFLGLAHLPPDCSLDISGWCDDDDPLHIYEDVIVHVSAFSRNLQTINDISFSFNDEYVELELRKQREPVDATNAELQTIALSFSGPHITFNIISRLFRVFPFHIALSISLDVEDPSMDTWDYMSLLRLCEAVTNLSVRMWMFENFVTALATVEMVDRKPLSSPPSTQNKRAILPNLAFLHLREEVWESIPKPWESESWKEWVKERKVYHRLLVDALYARATSGHTVRKLKLDSWFSLDAETVSRLQSVVTEDVELVELDIV